MKKPQKPAKSKKGVRSDGFRPVGHEWGHAQNEEIWIGPMTKQERKYWFHHRQAVAQMAFVIYDDLTSLLPGECIKPQTRQVKNKSEDKPRALQIGSTLPEGTQVKMNEGLEPSAREHNINLWKKSHIHLPLRSKEATDV